MNPDLSNFSNRAARDQDCVFDGEVLLVVEAVCYPQLYLVAAKFAGVHPPVERVLVMIRRGADVAEMLREFVPGPVVHVGQSCCLVLAAGETEN